ncbi:hypothetical protein PLESTM_000019400 [Pleodorina starrii]|nr:hypothetical protein PLESTM_000019400 [Pleodorina starrii]
MLEALHKALGKQSVIVFGPADVSVAFGLEWDALQELANGENFMWLRGDAYEITWNELFSDDLPLHIRHIWFAEYDVGWTGDLLRLLSTPSLFPPSADFICSTERKPEPGLLIESDWAHFHKRNWLPDADVRQCLVMLVRYSRRMLATIRSETRMRHFQYSEMTGATICARHGGWCTVGTFNDTHPAVGRDAAGGETMFSWSLSISQETWEGIAARLRPGEVGHLYHALKW